MRFLNLLSATLVSSLVFACQAPLDTYGESTFAAGAEDAIVALVNDPQISFAILDDDVGLDRRAAQNLVDERPFATFAAVDAVSYVGQSALDKLLAYALAQGYGEDTPEPVGDADAAMLALVNDPTVSQEELDDAARLDRRAAADIVAWRDAGNVYLTVDDVDDRKYVGATALERLREYALAQGYGSDPTDPTDPVVPAGDGSVDVVFSPQSSGNQHTDRVADLIDAAQYSVDIAMYSFSVGGVYDALEDAVGRGVKIRMVFEMDSSSDTPRAERLENMGVNVRTVNKIMHHKFAIIDGPRDDAARASTARLTTGSGNWSTGAANKYDENTLFVDGDTLLSLQFQREFNHMWEHSKDFVEDDSLAYELSSLEITDAMIAAADNGASSVFFTSDNFSVSGTTFRLVNGRNTVSDAIIQAINGATDSILVASGHLRHRAVAEALMARRAADPTLDIRVVLDGQEYVSRTKHEEQVSDRADCRAEAETDAQLRQCNDRGFYFGYQLEACAGDAAAEVEGSVCPAGYAYRSPTSRGDTVGVRYKFYSYYWHHSFAQMHNKLLIIDGDELWTGSFNLSDNAEHNTFENMVVLRGEQHSGLIAEYVAYFESLWSMNRAGAYDDLRDEIGTENVFPLVFDAMALAHEEVRVLKSDISRNCADIWNDPAIRAEPARHTVCYRD